MREWRVFFIVALTAAAFGLVAHNTVSAQMSGPITVSAQDASGTCATANACAVFPGGSIPAYAFDVTGTFSGTLTFEVQVDATTYRTVQVTNLQTGGGVTSTTAPGSFSLANTGFLNVRLRASSWSSGSAAVALRRGYAPFAKAAVDGSGTVRTSQLLLPDGTQTAPAWAFASEPTTGWYKQTLNYMGPVVGGVSQYLVGPAGTFYRGGHVLYFTSGAPSASVDLAIQRVNVGVLSVVNGGTGNPAINLNVNGNPTLSACGDGVLATNSGNALGRVTSAATMTGCTVTFSGGGFGVGNSAECFINNLVAARGFVSAASLTSFTVSGLTAGDDFSYWCPGR